MKLKILNQEFKFTLMGIVIYLLLTAFLFSLGIWQLNRAEQKRFFLEQQSQALHADVWDLNINAIENSATIRYHQLKVTGKFDGDHQFLIDNQILDGQAGYYVLTPLIIPQQNRAVLVNRGWLPLGADRNILPDLRILKPEVTVTGRLNQFPAVGIKLKGAEIPTDHWPAVVQVVDKEVLAAKLDYALYDFQLELDADSAEGYRREWKIQSSIPPEKHQAYAVQWFGLALTLTGLFFWHSRRKSL